MRCIYMKSTIIGILLAILLEIEFIGSIYISINNYFLCLAGIISAVLVYKGINDYKWKKIFLKLFALIMSFTILRIIFNFAQIEKQLYILKEENLVEYSLGYSVKCAAFLFGNFIGACIGICAVIFKKFIKK